jgi:hypothetical protein
MSRYFSFLSVCLQTLLSTFLISASGVPPSSALATQSGPSVKTGPAVGDKIPPFKASDQNSEIRDFESIRGPKGALILFFRSADW